MTCWLALPLFGGCGPAPFAGQPVPPLLDRTPLPIVMQEWIECYDTIQELRMTTSRTFESWEDFERARGITLALVAAGTAADFVVLSDDREVPRDVFTGVAARMRSCVPGASGVSA